MVWGDFFLIWIKFWSDSYQARKEEGGHLRHGCLLIRSRFKRSEQVKACLRGVGAGEVGAKRFCAK